MALASSSSMPSGAAAAAPKIGAAGSGSSAGGITRRLQSELMNLMMSGNKEVSAFPNGDNLFEWAATISGSKGTVYDGLTFKLKVSFPADYPFTAPTVTFVTPCYHPNVDGAGNICLDILKDKWSASYSVSTLLISLQSLLSDPNVASPLNQHAAQLWENQAEYRKVLIRKYKEATGTGPDA